MGQVNPYLVRRLSVFEPFTEGELTFVVGT